MTGNEHARDNLMDASRKLERAAVLLREAAQAAMRGVDFDNHRQDALRAMFLVVEMILPKPVLYGRTVEDDPRCPRCADRGTDGDHVCDCEAGEPYRRSVAP